MTTRWFAYLLQGGLLSGALVLLSSTAMSAGFSATDNASSSAVVIAPITLSKTSDLQFGSVIPTGIAGTVVIDPDGGVRTQTDVDVLPATGPPARAFGAANFQVAGQPGFTYSITLPASIILDGPGLNTMLVDIFTDKAVNLGTLVGGNDSFTVGATLHVGANQVAGGYFETFTAIVTYD